MGTEKLKWKRSSALLVSQIFSTVGLVLVLFLNCLFKALDIIGLSVFNYNFGSVTSESPVIKAVYSALVEAEHRSMTPAPYWDLPLANQLVPRLRKFNSDLKLLNDVLDDLITRAKKTRSAADIEELEKRNYAEVDDPSMLRFLVDMRGAGEW